MNLRPRSFGAKLLVLFIFVVATGQFATWLLVSLHHQRQARRLIEEQLRQADQAFARIIDYRNALLSAGTSTAARNHEIRELFVSDDAPTLASTLESVRLANRSHVVAGLALDARLLAASPPLNRAGDTFVQLVQRAEADPGERPTATGYGFLDGQLHSLVVGPVLAPDIIAWLAIGFRIDQEFVRALQELTGIDVSFFSPAGQPLATTLPPAKAQALAAALPRLPPAAEGLELRLADDTALVSTRRLPTGRGEHATLVLQFSLDEKLASARETELLLLEVAFASLLAATLLSRIFARRLTRPIHELVGQTQRIAQGDYTVRPAAYRLDELGHLSRSFDDMARGLALRDRLRDLLDKNVSPEVAAQLIRDGDALGGEEREVTILFADLRGFTTLSERLPAPELLTLLNRYLDRMSGAIEAQGGVIDKFIGDAIMALFGAPVPQGDAADRAVAAARAMEQALAALNAELAAEGRAPLALGIGINTARVVAGRIGSQRRRNYSVIGDGVNVAARLQALTRTPEYQTNIIVSAATVAAARAPLAPRALGRVPVKGRAEPVEIFAIAA
ncbi:MAG: HAMP domain-containing protein [Verrucomicrobia bacterium]|nr:HAMP domain-containing protein [Verrucomicrobiota bacterium]